MRNPLLLTSAAALTCLALNACGGSNEPAKSPDDSERAANKAEDAADKAEDKADKAADKAEDAADKATDTKSLLVPAAPADFDRTSSAELRAASLLGYSPRS